MADFPTTPALLDKTQVLAATDINAVAVPTAAVATGAGVNSGAQGFETARAQGVEFFFSFTAGVSDPLAQLTAAVEFSADGNNWYDDDAQTVVWGSAAALPAAGDEVRLFVKTGSRLDKFVRLAFTTSTTQATDSQVTCEARVAGITRIFEKNAQVS